MGDPANSSVLFGEEDTQNVFVKTETPFVGPVNESVEVDKITVPNPAFTTFKSTWGPAPHGPVDSYVHAWSNYSGFYVSALLPDANSPGALKWWNFRQLEWGSDPAYQGWFNYTDFRVDPTFDETDTHFGIGGNVDGLCDYRSVDTVGATCRASHAQDVVEFVNGSTPDVVWGREAVRNTSLTNAPPGSQVGRVAFDSSREASGRGVVDLASSSDARLSRSLLGPPDGALPRSHDAAGLRVAPAGLLSVPTASAKVASATAPRSSGSVALVTAVVALGAAALVFFAMALFSRLSREDVLAQENRARLLAGLKEHPLGVRACVLGRRLGLDRRTTNYHLGILAKRGLVAFFERGDVTFVALPEVVAVAREARLGPEFEHAVSVAVLRELSRESAAGGALSLVELAARVGFVSRSQVWRCLSPLERAGIIVGEHAAGARALRYRVRSDCIDEVARLLATRRVHEDAMMLPMREQSGSRRVVSFSRAGLPVE